MERNPRESEEETRRKGNLERKFMREKWRESYREKEKD